MSYDIFMALTALISGVYFCVIAFGFHTPKTKREPNPEQLKLLRWATKIAGPASIVIGIVYGLKALGYFN